MACVENKRSMFAIISFGVWMLKRWAAGPFDWLRLGDGSCIGLLVSFCSLWKGGSIGFGEGGSFDLESVLENVYSGGRGAVFAAARPNLSRPVANYTTHLYIQLLFFFSLSPSVCPLLCLSCSFFWATMGEKGE